MLSYILRARNRRDDSNSVEHHGLGVNITKISYSLSRDQNILDYCSLTVIRTTESLSDKKIKGTPFRCERDLSRNLLT